METNCYNILLSVIENIEYQEEYNNWIQAEWDEYNIREANRQFNELMNDNDAWGNID